jgi:hypothetical protein
MAQWRKSRQIHATGRHEGDAKSQPTERKRQTTARELRKCPHEIERNYRDKPRVDQEDRNKNEETEWDIQQSRIPAESVEKVSSH